jgi:two-component system, chemotaxis family, chemotaxis protein CheY
MRAVYILKENTTAKALPTSKPERHRKSYKGTRMQKDEHMTLDIDMKILIADDMQTMRSSVRSVIKELGFTKISEAADGIDALSQLKKDKYDILFMDWNMPNMDGITLLRLIRGDAELKDIIVLMVTAEKEKAHVIEAMKAGISDYIVKPFTADILKEKIKHIIAKVPHSRKPGGP